MVGIAKADENKEETLTAQEESPKNDNQTE